MTISFQMRESLTDNHYKNILNDSSTYGDFELEMRDILYTNVDGIKNSNYIECNINKIHPIYEDKSINSLGKVLLYRKNLPINFVYGECFKIRGSLSFIKNQKNISLTQNDFENSPFGDYAQYLKTNNIYAIIYPDKEFEFKSLSSSLSPLKIISRIRDYLLNKSVMHLTSNDNKNLAATIFYGCKGAVTKEMRRVFTKTGIIHLFAISGLHVALVMAMALIIFIFVPYSYRYMMTTLIVFIFVLSTGANVPAMRAFFMILIWAIFNSFYLKLSNLNLLLLSGGILLIYNPFYIIDVGFLFSFLISFVLILLTFKYHDFNNNLLIKERLVPIYYNRENRKQERKFTKIFFAFASCIVAFCAGSVLSLMVFGKIYLISILINAILIPLLIYIFYLMLITTFFNLIGLNLEILNHIFDKTLKIFLEISDFLANYSKSLNFGAIGIFEFIIFLVALTLMLLLKRFIAKLICLIVITLLILFNIYQSYNLKSSLLILKNEDQKISFLFCEPKIKYSSLINVTNYNSSQIIMKYLSDQAIKTIDQVILANSNKNNLVALENLYYNFDIGNITFLNITNYKKAEILENKNRELLTKIKFLSSKNSFVNRKLKYNQIKNIYTLEYFNLSTILSIKVVYDQDNKTITIFDNGKKSIIKFENSNVIEMYKYEF